MELTLNDIINHQPLDLSLSVERKFEESFDVNDWEIETDTGWSPIKRIGKTIPYDVWEIKTISGKSIKCADDHILFDDTYDQIFAKDLNKDTRPDRIITKDGAELVEYSKELGYTENMYDLEVDDSNHRYWTNDILSHNSIWLANDAANFVRMGHNVVFITAEMSAQKVLKRIGSNLLDISMMEYDEKSGNRDFIKRKLERISRGLLPPGKLFVKEFPTSQGTVLDIEAYLKELEESQDHKVSVLIVDYINILANYRNPNTENTYMKIKQIAEDLRALAVKRELLVISATQLNRGAWDNTEIKMENIAESAGLAHTADVMYALIQDSMMHANREYWLKVLKIRDGQGKGSRCRFNINYDYMRLTETDDITN
jgi:KaiC/GvpD/RAD55 family RecA-like ATPase